MAAKATVTTMNPDTKPAPTSRIVFTEGGKGGVGKTAFATLLIEWYRSHGTPYKLIDMDTENKARGSLRHYFQDARKVNMHTSEGLDAFVDALDDGEPIVIADMGAGARATAVRWFNSMHSQVAELGVAFTAVGIVTPDPASVESVLAWGAELQDRVQYLIVRNANSDPADFGYWEHDPSAVEFRRMFSPVVIDMEYRLPKVEHPAREHGYTMRQIAMKETDVADLRQTTVRLRAAGYHRNLFAELDRVKDLLLL